VIDKCIRVGLIGYGFAGRTFHAPVIRCVPGLALTTFGSTQPDAVYEVFPDAKVCSPEEVISNPEIDLVVVASPNDSHYSLAASALRAGKDVVVDKPFTVALEEARSLLRIAEEHGRLLSVFHNRRWDSEVLATKAVIKSGELGVVKHYESHIDRFRPNVRQRWRENPGPGAGLWFDLGPHLIDQAVYLFGLPNSVNANFGILRDGGLTDDWAHVQLNYDHMRVVLQATLLAAGGCPRTIVHGTKASWIKTGADVQEAQLISGMLPTDEGFGVDSSAGILFAAPTNLRPSGGTGLGEQIEIPSPVGNQIGYYMGIRDAILKKQPPPVPAKDGLANIAILEASFESGKLGRTLPIPLTDEERAWWS